ncbi:MAG: hypothetical protein J5606_02510 [Bacteroidales bacterium]|nr:hypothetical protein [Bacteroidales bacterium]
MEQNNDIKEELQQELHCLQQEIEQHSTFNPEVWKRSVRRYTRSLYRKNIFCIILLTVMMSVSIGFLSVYGEWPWWVIVPYIVFFGVMIVDNLVATRGMARPNVGSKEGLRSLRECVQMNSTLNFWRRLFYYGFGTIVLTVTFIYLWFYDRQICVSVLISTIICSPIGYVVSKRVKKRYNELGEEIDELLKE